MAKGFIIVGLAAYILLGALAVGVYAYDTSGIKERAAAAQRVREAAANLPERNSSDGTHEESEVSDGEYDVHEGTAGAARDF